MPLPLHTGPAYPPAPARRAGTDNDDDTPVRERARDQLRECQALTRHLFDAHWGLLNNKITNAADVQRDSLSNPNHKSPPVVVMEKLVDQQNILRKLIDEVLEHQRLNGIMDQLRRANAVEDDKIAQVGTSLRSAESVLQNALDEARPRLAAMKRANKRPVDVDEVISYGSKISASLSAPASWDPSPTYVGNFQPPAPSEAMMRSGRLAQLALKDDHTHVNPT